MVNGTACAESEVGERGYIVAGGQQAASVIGVNTTLASVGWAIPSGDESCGDSAGNANGGSEEREGGSELHLREVVRCEVGRGPKVRITVGFDQVFITFERYMPSGGWARVPVSDQYHWVGGTSVSGRVV